MFYTYSDKMAQKLVHVDVKELIEFMNEGYAGDNLVGAFTVKDLQKPTPVVVITIYDSIIGNF